MNEIQYAIAMICQRRQVVLTKVESVAFNVSVTFGLADGSYLLPVVANVFYYLRLLNLHNLSVAGAPLLTVGVQPSGVGSGGTFRMPFSGPWPHRHVELDYMQYNVNTHSAGTYFLYSEVFKVTYA